MRVLITGASGLAGGYLAATCAEAGDEVVGVSRRGVVPEGTGSGRPLDLQDAVAVRRVVADVAPDVVYHLAALSSVGRSWQQPAETMQVNVTCAVNLLEALRLGAPRARVVWVSSCEVYGVQARVPISETAALAPASPYAVSKVAGEQLATVYAEGYGLPVLCARPFNHAGPGQRPIFLLSSLAQQAAQARREGLPRLRVVTGNPDTRRDFTDVRDVVRAYRLLAGAGRHSREAALPAGERAAPIFNVSSGRSISAAEQVAVLAELLAPIEVEHIVDPARVRTHEVMDLTGSYERLHGHTGWQPEIPFRETMRQTIGWWEERLESSASR